jgi:4'-phosphopantetheinyl transferase
MRDLMEETAGAELVNEAPFTILDSCMALPEEIAWPLPPVDWLSAWPTRQFEVHIWAIPLRASSAALETLESHLSPSERERAGRFHSRLHRDRFITGRGWLRALLARYLEAEPRDLEFVYGPQGKPSVQTREKDQGVEFNLAHSDELALLAVTREAAVGIDVERLRPLEEADDLVARFFSERESAAFCRLPREEKLAAFFNLWTRKEAWLKATGEGIAHSLQEVEVSFLPGEAARLLAVPGRIGSATGWTLHDLAPAPGFAGALAIRAPAATLRCWKLSEMEI